MKKLVSLFHQQFKSVLSCVRLNTKCITGTETIFNPSYLTTDTPSLNFWFVLLDKDKDLKEKDKDLKKKTEQHESTIKCW